MRRLLALFSLALVFALGAEPALADRRVALLIGNSGYQAVPALRNPRNDVMLLKKALDEAGFDVVTPVFDLGQKPLLKALNAFADVAAGADIAVIYYSGHGLEMGGVNYLVPVDATLATDEDVKDETVSLERALDALDGAKTLKLVILDACRTNPFLASMRARSGHKAIEKGLAPVEPPGSDMLIAYAAKAGTPALDGDGDDSPFAIALAKRLPAPGDDVELALRKVRDDVLLATHGRQEPFKYGSLGGSVIPLSKAAPAPGDVAAAREAAYESAMSADTVEALNVFLSNYPAGPFSEFARRERDRLAKLALNVAPPLPAPSPVAPCGGVTTASLASRGVEVLKPDEACALTRGDVFKECADCPAMVVVPEGLFTMGSPPSEPGRYDAEGPQHVVKIARAFAVGKFDVTKDEFAAFVKDTGYDAGSKCWSWNGKAGKGEEVSGHSWRDPGFAQTGSHPVVCVNWNDAQKYVEWLSAKAKHPYRLLSEPEWEYSARARTEPGTYPRYFFGDSEADFCQYGNGADQTAKAKVPGASGWVIVPCSDGYAYTSPAGAFKPNAFGLYDMHGNVWQWVQDCYDKDAYKHPASDGSPIEYAECGQRVSRGGSWNDFPRFLRAADRGFGVPSHRYFYLGFRVARTLLP
jgi:formylglycine-generating enzyme required for sulfatase activity